MKISDPKYALLGSVFGITCGAQRHCHDAKQNETPYCEECDRTQQGSGFGAGFKKTERTHSHWEDNPILQSTMAKAPEVGCFEWETRKGLRTQHYVMPCYCEECPRQPGHKWTDHRRDEGMTADFLRLYDASKPKTQRRTCGRCPCPRHKWVKEDRKIQVLKPGHMQRLGIPWSIGYVPHDQRPKWRGACFQDFIVTFGRRYVSPNYWTSNAPHPAYYNDRTYPSRSYAERMKLPPEERYRAIQHRLRPYGGGAFHIFRTLDEAVPFVRERAKEFQRKIRMVSAGRRDIDPYQYETIFFQWARLSKVPFSAERAAKRISQLGKPGICEQWNIDERAGKHDRNGELKPEFRT